MEKCALHSNCKILSGCTFSLSLWPLSEMLAYAKGKISRMEKPIFLFLFPSFLFFSFFFLLIACDLFTWGDISTHTVNCNSGIPLSLKSHNVDIRKNVFFLTLTRRHFEDHRKRRKKIVIALSNDRPRFNMKYYSLDAITRKYDHLHLMGYTTSIWLLDTTSVRNTASQVITKILFFLSFRLSFSLTSLVKFVLSLFSWPLVPEQRSTLFRNW